MNLKVTLGFLVLLALLAVATLGLDRLNVGQSQGPDPTAVAKTQELTIFNFDDRLMTAVEGTGAGKTMRVVKGTGDLDWTVADSGEPANSPTIASLLIRLSALRATSHVGDAGDLNAYGLAQPKIEFVMEMADGSKLSLQFGNQTPINTGTYVKRGDQSVVYVVGTQLADDIQRLINDPKPPATPTPRPSSTATPEGTPSATLTPAP